MNVCLAPHHDDETLFAGMLAQHYHTRIVVVLRSDVQEQRGTGITSLTRDAETGCAAFELGLSFALWDFPDSGPDWDAVESSMRALDDRLKPEVVLAPAVEDGGHDQHNSVGEIAGRVFGSRVVAYLTYRRGFGRSMGRPFVGTGDQIERKLRALACYRSQICEPSTCSWFVDGLTEQLA